MEYLLVPVFFLIVYALTIGLSRRSVGKYRLARWEADKGFQIQSAQRIRAWWPFGYTYEIELLDRDGIPRRCLLRINRFWWHWHYRVEWLTEGSPRD